MRQLWPSFVFLLLRETELTASGGTPTAVAAPKFSSLSREKVTASVKRALVQLRDESEDKIGDKKEEKEERVGFSQTSPVVEGATHLAGWNGWSSSPLDYALNRNKFSEILKESNIVNKDQMTHWLTKFRTPGQSFRGDDLVMGLIRDGHGKRLAELFHQMWYIPELNERAAMMQRALLVEVPTLLSPVLGVWLRAKVTPAEAFHMMPISAEKSPIVAFNKGSSPTVNIRELGHWLAYVRDYRRMLNDFSHDQVMDVLVRAGLPEEQLVQAFNGLRDIAGMTTLVDALQRCLFLRSQNPPETLKLMFNAWSESKVDPKEVFHMLPIPGWKILPGSTEKRESLDVSYPMLGLWIYYVSKFPFANPSFRDDLVIDVLVDQGLPEVELVSFFNWLRGRENMKGLADLLQKKLALRSPDPAKTCKLLTGVWKNDVSLEDAYHMMPIPAAKSSGVPAEEEPSTLASYQMLERWIDYGYKDPYASPSPWDDRVIEVLLADKRPEEELVKFFNWLRGRPESKERADLLQKKLALRSMAPLKTLQLMADVWRNSDVDLEEAYHMMSISAEANFRGVVAPMLSWTTRLLKLQIWIKYVFESGNRNNDYGRVVAVLLADKRPVKELVNFFNSLRVKPDMTKTADLLQKELALKVPTSGTLNLMFHAWTHARVSPDAVYHMMPFPAKKNFLHALKAPGLPASCANRELWIDYVVVYRNKVKDFSNDQVINVLVDDGLSEANLVTFFNWLRGRENMKGLADLLQKKLALRSPDPAKMCKLLTGVWNADVSVDDAYHMIPISAAKRSERAAGEESIWMANFDVLEHWLRHARKFQSEGSNDQVIEQLKLQNMGTHETIRFFRKLRRADGMRAYANTLEGVLIANSLESEEKLNMMIAEWQTQGLNPEEAYPMIISATNRLTVADGEMSDVPVIFRLHEKWLQYVLKFRSTAGIFVDDQVIEVLLNHKRSDFDVVKFLEWLQRQGNRKSIADALLQQLRKLAKPAVLSKTS